MTEQLSNPAKNKIISYKRHRINILTGTIIPQSSKKEFDNCPVTRLVVFRSD